MKKLSLKKLNLSTGDLLQREQLRTVFGGYGQCKEGTIPCSCSNGTVGCSGTGSCSGFCGS